MVVRFVEQLQRRHLSGNGSIKQGFLPLFFHSLAGLRRFRRGRLNFGWNPVFLFGDLLDHGFAALILYRLDVFALFRPVAKLFDSVANQIPAPQGQGPGFIHQSEPGQVGKDRQAKQQDGKQHQPRANHAERVDRGTAHSVTQNASSPKRYLGLQHTD